MKTQVLDPKNPCSDSKVDWHSMLNFGIIITDYEGNIIDFDFYFFKIWIHEKCCLYEDNFS
jgi:hypothetical protein